MQEKIVDLVSPNNWIPVQFSNDLVSVVIPTFNRLSLLTEAIESVFTQTYRPLECIVVDDGSTEDVKSVVERLASNQASDVKLKYMHQKNSGAPAARNTGTRAAKGEFIQYLDSDDILYHEKISSQVEYLRTHVDVDAVFGDWHTGNPVENEIVEAYAKDDLIEQMLTEKCIANFSMLMRRGLINKIGSWDEELKRYQEIDFHLRGLVKGGTYSYLKNTTGLFRTHSNSRITNTAGASEILRFYKKWESILVAVNRFNKEMQLKFAALYLWFFYRDVQYGTTQINLLKAIIKIDPENSIFNSKKFQLMRRWLGEDVAIRLFLAWMVRNIKKQSKQRI